MGVNIDAGQRNADWIKTTAWEYPTDAEYFLAIIGGPDQLDHFMTLPVAEQMPQSLAVELGVRTGKSVMLKHLPGQHDQLDHGDRGSHAPEVDPLEHVKFTIGTLDEAEQKTVRETLNRLGTKYPTVAKLITSVAAVPLKTRWGSFDDQGRMKFTNYGREDERYRDPLLDATVAHEFGHALINLLAGRAEPPERPMTVPVAIAHGIPRDEANQAIRGYNQGLRQHSEKVFEIATDIYRQISEHFGGTGEHGLMKSPAILEQMEKEFPESADYVIRDRLELLCQAFGHYETGRHGVIADIVGRAVEERMGS